MKNNFKIYTKGNKQIIERLIYPRFKGVITFNSKLSDVEDIEMLDSCNDVMLIAKAMREAGYYIINTNFNKNKNA